MAHEATPPRRTAGRAGRDDREVREAILVATRRLLDERRFDELSVADILTAAGVARGSFYFYFAGKNQVLAELTRRAVALGHEAAEPWLASTDDPRETIRHGISEGAKLWRAEAPVLRAMVENWRSDEELGELWLSLMSSFTAGTAERIAADRAGEEQGAGEQTAGEQSAGEHTAGDRAAGEQSAGNQSVGGRGVGEQTVGEQSAVDRGIGEHTVGEQSAGALAAGEQTAGGQSDAGAVPTSSVNTDDLAAALTWLGERLYYLAAIGVEPFADEDALVDVLTHIWMSVLHPAANL
ncbi:TetR/AcrR family transcriptional regulator [Catenulispora acidiphila]|nr:TetR/AcrR family transcriptional regulator [Catenulispora acidiphila]